MDRQEFRKYGLLTIGILVFAKLFIQPLNQDLKEYRDTISELENTYKEKYKLYLKLISSKSEKKPNLDEKYFYPKDKKDIEIQIEMIDRLTTVSKKHNLDLLNFEMPSPTEKEEGFKVIPVLIRLKGTPKNLVMFYDDVRKLDKVYKVIDFETAKLQEDFSFTLTFIALKVAK
jgi:Tfp pilus assembly protein PilO